MAGRAPAITSQLLERAPHDIRWAYKKSVTLAQSGVRLSFAVSQDLFSSANIDAGTALLIRTLADKPYARSLTSVLDYGCGYGPIGMFLAAINPDATVRCTDRDLLAAHFTTYNAALNRLRNINAQAELDVGIDGLYDLIVSNIPAKAGPAVIRQMLLRSGRMVRPDGIVAVVVIDRIAEAVEATLVENEADVIVKLAARGYTCFHYRALPGSPPTTRLFDTGAYDRAHGTIHSGKTTVTVRTAWGLPEFDTPNHATSLAAKVLPPPQQRRRVALAGVGQGYLGCLVAAQGAEHVELVDRDLLALTVAERNVAERASVAATLSTQLAPTGADFDLALVNLRPTALPDQLMLDELRSTLTTGGELVLYGRSTDVTRVLGLLPGQGRRAKSGGFSAVSVRV